MYGFKKTTSQGGGKFGLNQKATLTKFEFNPNGGKDGAESNCVDISVDVNGREFRQRFYEIDKVWTEPGPDGGDYEEITDKNSQEYKDAVARDAERLSKIVSQYGIAIMGEKEFEEYLSEQNIRDFKTFIQAVEKGIKSVPEWNSKPLDVFLMYQWQPRGEETRTYLELPSKLKAVNYGLFVVAHVEGNFEASESGGLKYTDPETKVVHPFKRSEWFRESNFGKPTDFSKENSEESAAMNNSSENNSVW